MPIVSKPASIEKNTIAEFTLNKSTLANVASVVADSYFSDMLNWSEVLIYYKSSEGNQREILKFDAIMASPTANFLVSEFARDIFEVQKIVIKDFDNGSFVIQRSELVAAEFDVDMSISESLKISQESTAFGVFTNIGTSTFGVGQRFTPTEEFVLTGVEFNLKSLGTSDVIINLRSYDNINSSALATSDTVSVGSSAGWVRFDFSNYPITITNAYHLEIVLLSGNPVSVFYGDNFYADGFATTNSFQPHVSYTYDLAFRIYGN